jgi:hypothetical protein
VGLLDEQLAGERVGRTGFPRKNSKASFEKPWGGDAFPRFLLSGVLTISTR